MNKNTHIPSQPEWRDIHLLCVCHHTNYTHQYTYTYFWDQMDTQNVFGWQQNMNIYVLLRNDGWTIVSVYSLAEPWWRHGQSLCIMSVCVLTVFLNLNKGEWMVVFWAWTQHTTVSILLLLVLVDRKCILHEQPPSISLSHTSEPELTTSCLLCFCRLTKVIRFLLPVLSSSGSSRHKVVLPNNSTWQSQHTYCYIQAMVDGIPHQDELMVNGQWIVPHIFKLLPKRHIFFDLVIRFITNRMYAFFCIFRSDCQLTI